MWLCSYYESCVGLSKGVVLLVVLPLVYRCLRRPANDYAVCLIGMLFNMGTQSLNSGLYYILLDISTMTTTVLHYDTTLGMLFNMGTPTPFHPYFSVLDYTTIAPPSL